MQQESHFQTKLILIRHAQSELNLASHNVRTKYNLPYQWDLLNKHQQFILGVKYNPDLLDCSITKKGKQQCALVSQVLKHHKPDIILVSPLNRALQTCTYAFNNHQQTPVIVQPLLAEAFRSSCDLSGDIQTKCQLYAKFNFEQLKKQGQFWFIKNDSKQNQERYFSILNQQNHKNVPFRQKQFILLKYMIQTMIFETPKNMRERTKRIKKMLVEKYQGKYKNIGIVSHYNTINYLMSKSFYQNHQPQDCLHVANCQIVQTTLEQILKYDYTNQI